MGETCGECSHESKKEAEEDASDPHHKEPGHAQKHITGFNDGHVGQKGEHVVENLRSERRKTKFTRVQQVPIMLSVLFSHVKTWTESSEDGQGWEGLSKCFTSQAQWRRVTIRDAFCQQSETGQTRSSLSAPQASSTASRYTLPLQCCILGHSSRLTVFYI